MWAFLNVLSLALLLAFSAPINSETRNVYFSDFFACGNTNMVGRDDIIRIEGKQTSTWGSTAFSSCSLLFRAGLPEDKLCVKISKLTFSSSKLQYQYFDSLDPTETGITPAEKFDSASSATIPLEICSNQYEISMKLMQLTSGATIGEVDLLINVFNMQGTKRIAYMDEDCSNTFKLRDSTILVRNTNAAGAMAKVNVCHLYFEYIGTNPNQTICLQYMKLREECDYSLKILDGPQSGFTQAQTYTCNQTQPQTWCSTRTFIQFELENTGFSGLPENTFSIEVKDRASGDEAIPSTTSTNTEKITPNSTQLNPSSLVLSLIVAAVVLLLILVVGIHVVFWRRREHGVLGDKSRKRENTMVVSTGQVDGVLVEAEVDSEHIYNDVDNPYYMEPVACPTVPPTDDPNYEEPVACPTVPPTDNTDYEEPVACPNVMPTDDTNYEEPVACPTAMPTDDTYYVEPVACPTVIPTDDTFYVEPVAGPPAAQREDKCQIESL